MKPKLYIIGAFSALFLAMYASSHNDILIGDEAFAQAGAKPAVTPTPVEDDMHEFMEYVFQPTYLRLKEAMAAEPADDDGWKDLKSGTLILAEGGNLLLIRAPEVDADNWSEFATTVRELGGEAYRAAQERDFAAVQQHYKSMLMSCNRCHQQFADGEHQLTP